MNEDVLMEQRVFNTKRDFKEGMEELKHFYCSRWYRFEFFEATRCFPRPSTKIRYGVNVYKRSH